MAESTLTLKRDDLRRAIGNMLGRGIDLTAWDDPDFASRVDICVDIGCRWVYEPEILPNETQVHIWSFMQPQLASFALTQPYSTGTISVTAGVVTGSGTNFPAWAAAGEIVFQDQSYSVATRTNGTSLTLDDTSVNAPAGTTYTLQQTSYVLPDLFGGFMGDLYLNQQPNTLGYSLARSTKDELLSLQRSNIADFSAQPVKFAVYPQEQTGVADQKWLLTVWPLPDSSYTLTGYYIVNPYRLTSALPYPMGGLPLSECLRSAVLAAAEIEFFGEARIHNQTFRLRLQSAISFDRQRANPGNLGKNVDRSHEQRMFQRMGLRTIHANLNPTSYTGYPG